MALTRRQRWFRYAAAALAWVAVQVITEWAAMLVVALLVWIAWVWWPR